MEWSPKHATNAYLDTLKLCKSQKEKHYQSNNGNCEECHSKEMESIEFISALAAGMSAQLMVEVTPQVSSSTVALAAAARQTGGKLVCILPEIKSINESHQVIDDSGLHDLVEFRTGDPAEVLPSYENVDFSVVDYRNIDDYNRVLGRLDVNPSRSVVVANNLLEGPPPRRGIEREFGDHDENDDVEFNNVNNGKLMRSVSVKHNIIGKGMEITMIGKSCDQSFYRGLSDKSLRRSISERKAGGICKKTQAKSKWVVKVDEKTGEEHIFRVLPKYNSCSN